MPYLQSALAIQGVTVTRLEEYEEYHRRVVEECVELMGEDSREFYSKQCTYFDEWESGLHPRQVAQEQVSAMRELVAEAEGRKPGEKPPRRRFRAI